MAKDNYDRIAAAERYIASDRTDPFTRMRVYSHMKSGIASTSGAAFYDAELDSEPRQYTKNDGEVVKYTVPCYKNVGRP